MNLDRDHPTPNHTLIPSVLLLLVGSATGTYGSKADISSMPSARSHGDGIFPPIFVDCCMEPLPQLPYQAVGDGAPKL